MPAAQQGRACQRPLGTAWFWPPAGTAMPCQLEAKTKQGRASWLASLVSQALGCRHARLQHSRAVPAASQGRGPRLPYLRPRAAQKSCRCLAGVFRISGSGLQARVPAAGQGCVPAARKGEWAASPVSQGGVSRISGTGLQVAPAAEQGHACSPQAWGCRHACLQQNKQSVPAARPGYASLCLQPIMRRQAANANKKKSGAGEAPSITYLASTVN